MCDAASIELPPWAQVSAVRREHIARVTSLLVAWSAALGMPASAWAGWRDAGLWEVGVGDASEGELGAW